MQQFVDGLILNYGFLQSLPKGIVYVLFQLLFCLAMLMLFVSPFAAMAGFIERRVAGRIQSRAERPRF